MVEIVANLLKLQAQVRFFHWQTKMYARHMAFGGFYTAVDPLIDQLVEACMGAIGKDSMIMNSPAVLELKNMDEIKINEFLAETVTFLTSGLANLVPLEQHTDIANIRDGILGEINKLKYLLTLA